MEKELLEELRALKTLVLLHHEILKVILKDPLAFEKNKELKKLFEAHLLASEVFEKILFEKLRQDYEQGKKHYQEHALDYPPELGVFLGKGYQETDFLLSLLRKIEEEQRKDEEGKDKPQK